MMLIVLLRALLGVNFTRFALSFSDRFEGTGKTAGWIDHALATNRMAGFRLDFVWLVLSTPIILFIANHLFAQSRGRPEAIRSTRIDLFLSVVWLFAFLFYVFRLLFTGRLDFG
jgi:hypothetical protein